MSFFADDKINFEILKKRAFNGRWADMADGVIPLTSADPDFPVAPEIKQALIEYINGGYFSYVPPTGLPEFGGCLARCLKERKNEIIDENLVLPVDSAASAMASIARSFLKPGDEMICFDPCDFLFREAALCAGATPIFFPAKLKGSHIDLSDLEAYITPKTKMLGLCNPHNPYGVLYTREDLEHIMSLCEKYDIMIMNDEIWSDITYSEEKFLSILTLGAERCSRVLSVFGYSKSFGLAGLRIGAIYATDKDNFEKVVESSHVLSTVGGATSLSQIGAMAAMDRCYYWVDEFIKHLQGNRDYALNRLNKMPGITCHRPAGTYLLFPNVSSYGMTSLDFVNTICEKTKVKLVPGGHRFFGDLSEGYIRICFATGRGVLTEGLDRLEAGLEFLNK
ncbi:MAG: pyridoxal phosphate-dependent aminotransferase [Eubacteriaceae bacterium]|nr:pyridoxal phosphate-dependent aminotransferase [Eubacteriaceae bacterium]